MPSLESNQNKVENELSKEIFDSVIVSLVGKNDFLNPLLGWSTKMIQSPDDFLKSENKPLLKYLREYAKKNGIHTFYMPVVYSRQNGLINTNGEYEYEFKDTDFTIKKGSDAEGCLLSDGEAFVQTPADCLTLVAVNDLGRVVTVHAGRETIFDVDNPQRATVIESILKAFGEGDDLSKIKIWAGFGISPGNHFKHEEDDSVMGQRNLRRREFLQNNFGQTCYTSESYLDLAETVKNIALKFNLDVKNIILDRSVCTATDKIGNKTSKYYSHRRSVEEGSSDFAARNLVIVSVKPE